MLFALEKHFNGGQFHREISKLDYFKKLEKVRIMLEKSCLTTSLNICDRNLTKIIIWHDSQISVSAIKSSVGGWTDGWVDGLPFKDCLQQSKIQI